MDKGGRHFWLGNSALLHLQNYCVNRQAISGLCIHQLHRSRFFSTQDVFHLHCLHHGERLAGFDNVPFADMQSRQ